MRKAVPVLAACFILAACGQAPPQAPAAPAPAIRLAAVPGGPAAGYFQLRIGGDRGALLAVDSPQAGRIEMHETMHAGTMTSMRPLQRIAVRDGETLVFAPGGRHLMLFDLAPAVHAGGTVSLVLHFERGAPLTLTAHVAAAGEEMGR